MNNPSDSKQELLAKRDQLRARLVEIEQDYRQGLDRDSEERAIQLENAEVLAGIAKVIAEELQQVEEALTGLG